MKYHGIESEVLHWPLEKREPNILTYITQGKLDLIINTPPRGIGPASLALMLAGQAQLGWDQFLGAMVSERFRPQVREALQALFTLLTRLAGDDTLQTPAALIEAVLEATGWIDSLATELDGHITLRNLRELESLAGEAKAAGVETAFATADVRDAEAVGKAVASAVERFGGNV